MIAQVAATACPPYNVAGFCRAFAAANANRLRIDPFEKKSKGRELRRVAPRSVNGHGKSFHRRRAPIVTFFSGKTGTKFSKKICVLPEMRTNWWCVSSRRVLKVQNAECQRSKTACKEQMCFWGKECLLIFQYESP